MLTTLKYRYRIYTGPTIVNEMANRLSQAYLSVVCVGTQHVYVDTNYSVDDVLKVLGPTWTWRDIENVRKHD